MATAQTPRVRGKWFVIAFVAVIAVVTATFLRIQLSGRGAKSRNYLALSYTAGLRDVEEGYYADAVKSLTPVVQAGTEPGAYGFRGEAYLRMDQYPQAEADFRKAVEREPHLPANQAGLGSALAAQGRHAEAVSHFDAALTLFEKSNVRPARVRRTGDTADEVRRLRAKSAAATRAGG